MRRLKNLMFVLAIAIFAISCSTPCPPAPEVEAETIDMDAVKAEVQAAEDAYEAAINNDDVEGMLAYYADDAVSMAPNRPALVGKEAIKARLLENQAKEAAEAAEEGEEDDEDEVLDLIVGDIMVDGDLVVETGTWTWTEGDFVATGKFLTVFKKVDGKYLAVRDIWNSDKKYGDDDEDEDDD